MCGGVCTPKVGAAYCFTAAEKTVSDPHLVFERPAQECVRVPPSSCFSSTKFHTRVLEMKARHHKNSIFVDSSAPLQGFLIWHLRFVMAAALPGQGMQIENLHFRTANPFWPREHQAWYTTNVPGYSTSFSLGPSSKSSHTAADSRPGEPRSARMALPTPPLRNSFSGEQPTNYMSLHPIEDVGVRPRPRPRRGAAFSSPSVRGPPCGRRRVATAAPRRLGSRASGRPAVWEGGGGCGARRPPLRARRAAPAVVPAAADCCARVSAVRSTPAPSTRATTRAWAT